MTALDRAVLVGVVGGIFVLWLGPFGGHDGAPVPRAKSQFEIERCINGDGEVERRCVDKFLRASPDPRVCAALTPGEADYCYRRFEPLTVEECDHIGTAARPGCREKAKVTVAQLAACESERGARWESCRAAIAKTTRRWDLCEGITTQRASAACERYQAQAGRHLSWEMRQVRRQRRRAPKPPK